jgi:6-pyruvoyl-tetrahydropterin synthase
MTADLTVITIGGAGVFEFSAAHAGLHDGEFEPLHGHTFTVTLRLHGTAGNAGMITDFSAVKKMLAAAVGPLRRRTLIPAVIPGGQRTEEGSQVMIRCGAKQYSFPAGDVLFLPVPNTTTEALAGYLLSQILPHLDGDRIQLAELTLAEASDTSATARARPGPA